MSFNSLKKTIKYRLSYSGTKETDLLYKSVFIENFDLFNENDLILIKKLFDNYSDNEIYFFLTKRNKPPKELDELFKKILDAK
tara:strand:- start:321 stop:569 length:249 start_codon:yes stop_codon:yes gene_type:complete